MMAISMMARRTSSGVLALERGTTRGSRLGARIHERCTDCELPETEAMFESHNDIRSEAAGIV